MSLYSETFKKKLKTLVSIKDITKDEMNCIIGMAQEFRYKSSVYETNNSLRNKYILQVSKSNMARTLISFQIAVKEMGGTPLNVSLTGEKLEEYLSDANYIKSLSLYGLTAIMLSTHQYQDSIRFSNVVSIPVVDISPYHSPTETLATILTILDKTRAVKNKNITLIGDFKNDLFNLTIGLAKMEAKLTLVPSLDENLDELVTYIKQFTSVKIEKDVSKALVDSEIVYLGRTCSQATNLLNNLNLLDDKIILGCLPSDKEVEKYLETHNEDILIQSENIIHIQKAILACII